MHANICDYLLDAVQNSIEAGAASVKVDLQETEDMLEVTVHDNGCGMSPEALEAAKDPFTTSPGKHDHRKVGLGIPFMLQHAETTGGMCDITSVPQEGTTIRCTFPLDHVDTPPVGDVVSTWVSALNYPGPHEMEICRSLSTGEAHGCYRILRSELSEAAGGLEDAGALALVHAYIASLEASLTQHNEEKRS